MIFSRMKKWYAAFALAAFFSVAAFGVGIGMDMDEMGDMTPCAFMANGASVCPMSVADHVSEWEGLFAPIAEFFNGNDFGAALAFAFTAFFVFWEFFVRDRERQKRKRIYAAAHFRLRPPHFLVYAFSRGILHPRLYATAK
jgi:hypothetical protein